MGAALPNEPLEIIATDKNAMFQTLSLMLAWADSLKDRMKGFKLSHRLDSELTGTYCAAGRKGMSVLGDCIEDALHALQPRKRKLF